DPSGGRCAAEGAGLRIGNRRPAHDLAVRPRAALKAQQENTVMVQESSDNQHATAPGVAAPLSLPLHTRLGEIESVSVIGEGGFSIVYLAHDHQLERTVAIKEYLPGAIAYRNAEGMVLPRFEKYDSTFKTGLQSFLKEARILAQFEHHSLIRIHRFWEQN